MSPTGVITTAQRIETHMTDEFSSPAKSSFTPKDLIGPGATHGLGRDKLLEVIHEEVSHRVSKELKLREIRKMEQAIHLTRQATPDDSYPGEKSNSDG